MLKREEPTEYLTMLIWNTRPSYIAKETTSLLKANGYQVIEEPLLRIRPLAYTLPSQFDMGIVLSQAVWYAYPDWFESVKDTQAKWLAVGAASKDKMVECGAKEVGCPTTPGSEGLLEMPVMQAVAGKSILLIGGARKRTLLKDSLKAKGAKIRDAALYERVATKPQSFAKNSEPGLILATSNEMIERLLEEAKAWPWILETPLLVISQRGYDYAIEHGFWNLLQAKSASGDDLLAAIKGASHDNA